ncbi:MAG: phenylalanine--tRNA ligase subunit beta [Candidatus Micrarchaeales archaeon]
MAIVTFELKDFKKLDIPWDKIEEAILSMGIEIEEKTDSEIKVGVTPNRPDLLDFNGLARSIENFTGKRNPQQDFYKIKNEPMLTIEVTPEVRKIRPYIAGIVVKNADLSGNMLKYLINFTEKFTDTYGRKRRKLAIGIHNLDVIKGNITYTASENESFVPLNGSKKMSFKEIIENHEKGITYQSTIESTGSKTLYPLIKDSEKILAMIPITNSDATKVTEKTTELFIDITGTSITTIRNAAALIACSFMYAGAEVYPVTVAYENGAEITPELNYTEIKVSMKKADKTLGVDTGKHNVIALANKMGHTAAKYGNSVLFYVPPYRVDVLGEQDIIEDIAVAYGYDRIVPVPVYGTTDGLASDQSENENRLATLMLGLGYTESINSILTNEKMQFENFGFEYKKENFISIAEAKTANITMLRFTIAAGLMENLADSRSERMPQRLFEIGRVFSLEKDKVNESLQLGIVSEHSKANFDEMRNVVDRIMKFMNLDYKIEQSSSPAFIEGRHAVIKVKGEVIGGVGEFHPKVLLNFGIEEPVVCAGINIIKDVKYD